MITILDKCACGRDEKRFCVRCLGEHTQASYNQGLNKLFDKLNKNIKFETLRAPGKITKRYRVIEESSYCGNTQLGVIKHPQYYTGDWHFFPLMDVGYSPAELLTIAEALIKLCNNREPQLETRKDFIEVLKI